MDETALAQEAAATFDTIQGGAAVRVAIMPLWMIFQGYLKEQYGTLPARLEQVPQASFARFVSACEDRGMPDSELHLMIAGMRMILLRSGWKPARLAELVAPRRRVRIANSPTGKYQFMLVQKRRKRPQA
jgi:hypothetical protein